MTTAPLLRNARFKVGEFGFSNHAVSQMEDRKITLEMVKEAVLHPAYTLPDIKGRDGIIHWGREAGVVLDLGTKTIITVLVKGSSKDEDRARVQKEIDDAQQRAAAAQQKVQAALEVIQMVVRGPDGAPLTFEDCTMKEYLLFWAKYYKSIGLG